MVEPVDGIGSGWGDEVEVVVVVVVMGGGLGTKEERKDGKGLERKEEGLAKGREVDGGIEDEDEVVVEVEEMGREEVGGEIEDAVREDSEEEGKGTFRREEIEGGVAVLGEVEEEGSKEEMGGRRVEGGIEDGGLVAFVLIVEVGTIVVVGGDKTVDEEEDMTSVD